MKLEEKAEEALETLWVRTQEEKKGSLPVEELGTGDEERALESLLQGSYVSLRDNQVRLTDKGLAEAANIVRRRRLAERLLVDVLDTKGVVISDKACKFEHLLDEGLDESICTLLGHPRLCPHGKPIPAGRCCSEGQRQPHRLVCPLSELLPGQRGKIAYLYASESSQLQKLMSMGILPGTPVSLIQSFPSYVFQVGQTQFAVDKDIADAIYVRREGGGNFPRTAGEEPDRHRWGGLRLPFFGRRRRP